MAARLLHRQAACQVLRHGTQSVWYQVYDAACPVSSYSVGKMCQSVGLWASIIIFTAVPREDIIVAELLVCRSKIHDTNHGA